MGKFAFFAYLTFNICPFNTRTRNAFFHYLVHFSEHFLSHNDLIRLLQKPKLLKEVHTFFVTSRISYKDQMNFKNKDGYLKKTCNFVFIFK